MYRALVVDDVEVIRQSVAGQINESGLSIRAVGTAENGGRALKWLSGYHADICVTDIRMPTMDGLQLIEQLREEYPWMASLVISSYDDFEYARSSIQLDAVDYVLKPIEEKALGLALERALNKVDQTRNFSATARMGRHLAECGELMQKWVDQVHIHSVTEEALLQETVDKLVLISQDQVLLLPALAAAWLLHVAGELRLQDYAACAANASQTHHVDGLLRRDDLRTEMSQTCHKTLQSGFEQIQQTYDGQRGNPQHHLVRKALSYIAQHYARSNLSLQEIADYTQFSKNHVANVFKQETGHTLWDHIISVRMQKARDLLANTDAKTLEIAMQVGYHNYSHFSQLFHQICGVTAQEYRRRMRT